MPATFRGNPSFRSAVTALHRVREAYSNPISATTLPPMPRCADPDSVSFTALSLTIHDVRAYVKRSSPVPVRDNSESGETPLLPGDPPAGMGGAGPIGIYKPFSPVPGTTIPWDGVVVPWDDTLVQWDGMLVLLHQEGS